MVRKGFRLTHWNWSGSTLFCMRNDCILPKHTDRSFESLSSFHSLRQGQMMTYYSGDPAVENEKGTEWNAPNVIWQTQVSHPLLDTCEQLAFLFFLFGLR